jgi:UPF0755 protein
VRKLAIVVVALLMIGVAADRGYEWMRWQVETPMSTSSQPVVVTVLQGASQDDLAAELRSKGLIRDQQVFLGYLRWLRLQGQGLQLKAGQFQLNRNMSMASMVQVLGDARAVELTVRMQEGDTLAMMAAQAQQQGAGTAADYKSAAGDVSRWHYDFLQGRPARAPNSLEGFLYPDTYQLLRGSTASDLIKRQLDGFGQAVTPDLRQQMAKATPARPAQTLYDTLVLASIVEKEVQKDRDRALVCDVFYNRLGDGMPLGSDATVLYAVGKQGGTPTQEDLQVDSPYNTRKFRGLPPGPISNPSLSSIKACVSAPQSNYLYFFTDPEGVAHFAATYAESLRQQQQYGLAGQ